MIIIDFLIAPHTTTIKTTTTAIIFIEDEVSKREANIVLDVADPAVRVGNKA